MRDAGDHHEHIAIYSDDVLVFSKKPLVILKGLEALFPLKGVGKPEFYLGGDVGLRDTEHGTVHTFSAKTYIKNVFEKIECLFETTLKNYGSPLEGGYHPELDTTDLLMGDEVNKCRMLVGCANWAVTLGRFDIHFATSTMGRCNAAPREGHLKTMLRVFGYLKHNSKRKLVANCYSLDCTKVERVKHEWSELHPDAREELPEDMPEPKGKAVKMTTFFDADHAHDLETRRSVTGVLIPLNSMPTLWHSKRQATVESSTYGSELVAARIATKLTIAMRYKLRMLGAPIDGETLLLGDNESVITNCSLPSSWLKKKHNAIAHHKVREAVAAEIITLGHVSGEKNVADLLTKALGPIHHFPLVKELLV